MIIDEENYLAHYGTPRKSGRYPWGSGGNTTNGNKSFLDFVDNMRKQGLSEKEIADGCGLSSITELRNLKTIARNQQKQADIRMAENLKDKGLSNIAIGERMSINESSVRSLLNPSAKEKANILRSTADMLKDQIEKKPYLDVGGSVEINLGISAEKLRSAIAMLKEEGYKVSKVKIQQLGTVHETTYKVLTKEEVPYIEILKNKYNIEQISDYSPDAGKNYFGIQPPISINQKRIGVTYAEQGGTAADGTIYVRPNVPDLDMGGKTYAQVRIAVDNTHFLKGMALIKDDLPDGVDLVFNTNKSDTGNKLDAMKPMKRDRDGNIDPDNPFGAVVRQLPKLDHNGKEIDGTVRSAMNRVYDEGDWDKWSKSLSTQFLSKQSPVLARTQLDMMYERKKNELDEIMSLANPTVKRKLLDGFASDADSSAVHMKAAALPRQRTQVLLPIPALKPNEIYAPNFKHGERVVLVRHPHGGPFEIPELVVNNRNRVAKSLMGQLAEDAVGINAKVAERLSGADFDGDTVLVIPNDAGKVRTAPALEGLKNFNPQKTYRPYDGMRTIDGGTYDAATKTVKYGPKGASNQTMQRQMGLVSNLITDMTIQGAGSEDLARAVRHSMVVIDSEKHSLDYKASASNNGIPALMAKYQNKSQGGASTLISRAKSDIRMPDRKPRPAAEGGAIDKATGEEKWVATGKNYTNKKGEVVDSKFKIKKLAATSDANTLSSGTPIEKIYADHSNRMKALANQARKSYVNTASIPYSPSAKAIYAPQVKTLNAKLNVALKNAPLERQAQVIANHIKQAKMQAYPDMSKSDLKKVKSQALVAARVRTGAGKQRIDITPDEWSAIQAGAISNHKLESILNNADLDVVKKLATPRTPTVMTTTKQARARQMLALGYSQAEVAAQLGVAVSTLTSSVIE